MDNPEKKMKNDIEFNNSKVKNEENCASNKKHAKESISKRSKTEKSTNIVSKDQQNMDKKLSEDLPLSKSPEFSVSKTKDDLNKETKLLENIKATSKLKNNNNNRRKDLYIRNQKKKYLDLQHTRFFLLFKIFFIICKYLFPLKKKQHIKSLNKKNKKILKYLLFLNQKLKFLLRNCQT
jgi:hypothetical protein